MVYAYANGSPISFRDPLGLWEIGDPLDQGVVNAVAGFGDGVSRVLTLGISSTADTRAALGIDGGVNMCSASYNGGKYAGYAWGAATLWAGGLNGGANSVFYAGNGGRGLAANVGTTIDQTLIGGFLDSLGSAVPRPVWQLASATFAANATDPALAVILYQSPTRSASTFKPRRRSAPRRHGDFEQFPDAIRSANQDGKPAAIVSNTADHEQHRASHQISLTLRLAI